jgi:hypothetical protein
MRQTAAAPLRKLAFAKRSKSISPSRRLKHPQLPFTCGVKLSAIKGHSPDSAFQDRNFDA